MEKEEKTVGEGEGEALEEAMEEMEEVWGIMKYKDWKTNYVDEEKMENAWYYREWDMTAFSEAKTETDGGGKEN